MIAIRHICQAALIGAVISHSIPAFAQSYAGDGDISLLESAVAKTSGFSIIQTFAGPSGLTGVVMLVNGHKMISYVTPDGKTWIAGYLMDLKTGANITQDDAREYTGSGIGGFPRAVIENVVSTTNKLAVVPYGNLESTDRIIFVFNPESPECIDSLRKVYTSAEAAPVGLNYEFAPVGGRVAAWLLSGTPSENSKRLQSLLSIPNLTPNPAEISKDGTKEAESNSALIENLPIHVPYLSLVLPSISVENIVQASGDSSTDQMGLSAVNSASRSTSAKAGQ